MSIEELVEGHRRFKGVFAREQALFAGLAESGQAPAVLWIGCSDSRVIPEQITGASAGTMLVMRNVANVVPPSGAGDDAIGAAIECAILRLHVSDIIVCGHTDCCGLKALEEGTDVTREPHFARWVELARPARTQALMSGVPAEQRQIETSKANVLLQCKNLQTYACVRDALKAGELSIHPWLYDLRSGNLLAYDEHSGKWHIPVAAETAREENAAAPEQPKPESEEQAIEDSRQEVTVPAPAPDIDPPSPSIEVIEPSGKPASVEIPRSPRAQREMPAPPVKKPSSFSGADQSGRKGQHDVVIADLTRSIERDPNDAGAYNGRGWAYGQMGRFDECILDAEKAIQINPRFASAYDTRALGYRGLGELDQAIADHTEAIRLEPRKVFLFNNRGITYAEMGEFYRAVGDFSMAISLDPGYADAYCNRGLAYVAGGQRREAVVDFKKAVSMARDPELRENARNQLRTLTR